MAIKTIEYKVNIAGITPATEQFGGTQGDHRVTKVEFMIDDQLGDAITDYATEINGRAMYRFDVYDGEGGIWQSEASELESYTVGIELEERHTRYGGKITVYLVITALSEDNETEMELYSFPSVLRLKNRSDGTYQDGENRESVTCLVEIAKANAEGAASYSASARAAELSARQLATEVEQKLKNGEFDGKDGVSVTHSFDGTVLKMTSASGTTEVDLKGEKGEQGFKGEKGDKGDDGEITNLDQTYSPTSENAQSGKAVAEAISGRIPKPSVQKNAPIETVTVMNHIDYTTITDERGVESLIPNDSAFRDVMIDDGNVFSKNLVGSAGGCLMVRDNKGNLWTGEPIDDQDCANKKYVDDLVGDIDSALTELHNYAQALIGGNS